MGTQNLTGRCLQDDQPANPGQEKRGGTDRDNTARRHYLKIASVIFWLSLTLFNAIIWWDKVIAYAIHFERLEIRNDHKNVPFKVCFRHKDESKTCIFCGNKPITECEPEEIIVQNDYLLNDHLSSKKEIKKNNQIDKWSGKKYGDNLN